MMKARVYGHTYLRKGISVRCSMPSKEGRFKNGHSASKAMGKRSNESISARELIAMVQRSILDAFEDLRRRGYYRGKAKGIRFRWSGGYFQVD